MHNKTFNARIHSKSVLQRFLVVDPLLTILITKGTKKKNSLKVKRFVASIFIFNFVF